MSLALLGLLLLSLRGRVRRFVRQLRQPKYLVGFAIGAGWLLFWLASSLRGGDWVDMALIGAQEHLIGPVGWAVRLFVAVAVALWLSVDWLLPWTRFGLPFKEAELHLLLPAPISRRKLIQFGLLKAQVPILFSAAIVSVALGSGSLGDRARLFGGVWLCLTILELHGRWRALVSLRLRQAPRAVALWGRGAIVAGVGIFWMLLAPRLWALGERGYAEWQLLAPQARDVEPLTEALGALTREGAGIVLLKPFYWLTAPLFADGASSFALALLPPLLMAVALHEAVVRSRARFEEPALEQARREASKKHPARRYRKLSGSARRRAPFALRAVGRPEVAILWKNLLQVSRFPLTRATAAAALVITLPSLALAVLDAPGFAFGIQTAVGGWLMIFAPWIAALTLRNDLRIDLRHVDAVRTWPVPARRLVLYEALAPALLGSWLGVGGAALLLGGSLGSSLAAALHGGPPAIRLLPVDALGVGPLAAQSIAVASVLPLIVALTALVTALQNLATLLFPAWLATDGRTARGMAAIGQHLLLASGLALAVFIGILPGAALVGLAVGLQWATGIAWSIAALPLWGVLAALPLFVETFVILRIAARMWQQLDPAQEILETSD